MNEPKSWSLAAELHPDIAAAYDAAQDAAAEQVIAWQVQHATTRIAGDAASKCRFEVFTLPADTSRSFLVARLRQSRAAG